MRIEKETIRNSGSGVLEMLGIEIDVMEFEEFVEFQLARLEPGELITAHIDSEVDKG